jgi:hypothetical protein
MDLDIKKIFPAALSFVLPGLGQLFCGNVLKSLFFFSFFAVGLFSSDLGALLTWAIFIATADAFFWCHMRDREADRNRQLLYAFCGLVGLFSWVNLLFALPIFR